MLWPQGNFIKIHGSATVQMEQFFIMCVCMIVCVYVCLCEWDLFIPKIEFYLSDVICACFDFPLDKIFFVLPKIAFCTILANWSLFLAIAAAISNSCSFFAMIRFGIPTCSFRGWKCWMIRNPCRVTLLLA